LANEHFVFDFYTSASLVAGIIVMSIVLMSLRKPLQATLIFVYPIAAAVIVATLLWYTPGGAYEPLDSGIYLHITLSVIAYCVLSIAALQALLVFAQNNNLKKRNNAILLRNLPPLLTMEKLLFEMIWSGSILLAMAIVAGFIFVDNLFTQQLAHKTFFSMLALGIFSTLLYGRHQHGWRGIQAAKLTLWGTTFLMLGFFGSKFVLEQLL